MKKIRIGLAGLGVVGKGVYEILQKDADLITRRSGSKLEITAVSARSKKEFLSPKIKFYPDVIDLANDPEIDVIVEVIGGTSIAKELLFAAIKNGKKFVTANKAVLAESGAEIAELVEKYSGHIGFEASTAGANPIIKAFKESFASGEITEFYAILNGTCNFILTKMGEENSDFSDTLKEAQRLGYAEADPTLDINGTDAAHKLTILAAIAGATKPAFQQLHIEGIDKISIEDILLAEELGYKIKLLAIYKNLGDSVQQTLYPALVKKSEKIAQVDGPFNAILSNTSNASWNMMIGRGAGGLTTGSAIVTDLVDIACERKSPLFGVKFDQLREAKIIPISERVGRYFLKLLIDKNLAQKSNLAEVIFGEKIQIEQAIFKDRDEEILGGFLTDAQKESDLLEALKHLNPNLVKSAKFLRVETTNF
jgi:homoserine dehydrogenase